MVVCCRRAEGRQEMIKKLVGSFKKNPNHLDFESGADVGSDAAYSDQQNKWQVGLLPRGTENISELFYDV